MTKKDLMDARQFTRLNFKRSVRLEFKTKKFADREVHDLSLGGMFVVGKFDQRVSDPCLITLTQEGPGSSIDLRARGKVIRVLADGIGIKFTAMRSDSFLYLQTLLLYEAEDPTIFGEDFTHDLSFKLIDADEN